MKKLIINLILLITAFFIFWIYNQIYAVTTTVSYVGTANDIWWGTFIWNNPNNAIWDTTTTAATSTIITKNAYSNNISLTNFNLTWAWLPFWSTINGIQIDVETLANHLWIKDTTIQLTKNGTNTTWNNYWNNTDRSTTKSTTTYWWLTDLWWTTWTYADLISSNFWVILQYRATTANRSLDLFRVNITVTYTPNNVPTNITLSNQDIPSELPVLSLVWTLSTTDADISDTHTYNFTCTSPWLDDSSFTINGSNLRSNEVFNYLIKSTYNICIRTDDWRWWTFDKNFVITITAPVPNNPPTNITLSNQDIFEFIPIWSLVWAFSTTDPDTYDTHIYDFTCTSPWADDSSFAIAGSNLNSNAIFNFATKSTYNICIRTDDRRWWTFDKNFVITILVNPNTWYAWTVTDISWGSYSWINPSNAIWNTTTTSATNTMSIWSSSSNKLSLTNFNFENLPIWSTIDGIQVDIERNVSNIKVQDTIVQLTKNGTTVIWTNNALVANGPTTKTITTYGGTTNLWWTTLTYAELKSSNFWVILQYNNTANWSQSVNVYRVKITVSYTSDTTPPTISSINYASGSLLPWGNHNIIINYFDLEADIDTTSDIIALYKWDGSSWWSDISTTWLDLASKVITTTSATYPTNNLSFWKYRFIFWIDDNVANSSSTWAVLYMDIPELIINTWSLDIWTISSWALSFSQDEIIVTVKTIWAWFNVQFSKDSTFDDGLWNIIIDWDWFKWVWYDKNPYSWTNLHINNNPTLGTQIKNINTNWTKNTYTYNIKIWTLIDDEQQPAGDYTTNISFYLNLTY